MPRVGNGQLPCPKGRGFLGGYDNSAIHAAQNAVVVDDERARRHPLRVRQPTIVVEFAVHERLPSIQAPFLFRYGSLER